MLRDYKRASSKNAITGGTEDECNRQAQGRMMRLYWNRMPVGPSLRVVCKVRTQQAENFDEEVKSLVSAWHVLNGRRPTVTKR